jgi:hypothetical protein
MNSDAPLIRKVIIADQPFYEYSYNYADLISEEESKFNFTNYIYNDEDQLVATHYYGDNALLSKDLQLMAG